MIIAVILLFSIQNTRKNTKIILIMIIAVTNFLDNFYPDFYRFLKYFKKRKNTKNAKMLKMTRFWVKNIPILRLFCITWCFFGGKVIFISKFVLIFIILNLPYI